MKPTHIAEAATVTSTTGGAIMEPQMVRVAKPPSAPAAVRSLAKGGPLDVAAQVALLEMYGLQCGGDLASRADAPRPSSAFIHTSISLNARQRLTASRRAEDQLKRRDWQRWEITANGNGNGDARPQTAQQMVSHHQHYPSLKGLCISVAAHEEFIKQKFHQMAEEFSTELHRRYRRAVEACELDDDTEWRPLPLPGAAPQRQAVYSTADETIDWKCSGRGAVNDKANEVVVPRPTHPPVKSRAAAAGAKHTAATAAHRTVGVKPAAPLLLPDPHSGPPPLLLVDDADEAVVGFETSRSATMSAQSSGAHNPQQDDISTMAHEAPTVAAAKGAMPPNLTSAARRLGVQTRQQAVSTCASAKLPTAPRTAAAAAVPRPPPMMRRRDTGGLPFKGAVGTTVDPSGRGRNSSPLKEQPLAAITGSVRRSPPALEPTEVQQKSTEVCAVVTVDSQQRQQSSVPQQQPMPQEQQPMPQEQQPVPPQQPKPQQQQPIPEQQSMPQEQQPMPQPQQQEAVPQQSAGQELERTAAASSPPQRSISPVKQPQNVTIATTTAAAPPSIVTDFSQTWRTMESFEATSVSFEAPDNDDQAAQQLPEFNFAMSSAVCSAQLEGIQSQLREVAARNAIRQRVTAMLAAYIDAHDKKTMGGVGVSSSPAQPDLVVSNESESLQQLTDSLREQFQLRSSAKQQSFFSGIDAQYLPADRIADTERIAALRKDLRKAVAAARTLVGKIRTMDRRDPDKAFQGGDIPAAMLAHIAADKREVSTAPLLSIAPETIRGFTPISDGRPRMLRVPEDKWKLLRDAGFLCTPAADTQQKGAATESATARSKSPAAAEAPALKMMEPFKARHMTPRIRNPTREAGNQTTIEEDFTVYRCLRSRAFIEKQRAVDKAVDTMVSAMANINAFVDSIEVDLSCQRCWGVLLDPQMLSPCGRSHCAKCAIESDEGGDENYQLDCGCIGHDGAIPNELVAKVIRVWNNGVASLAHTELDQAIANLALIVKDSGSKSMKAASSNDTVESLDAAIRAAKARITKCQPTFVLQKVSVR